MKNLILILFLSCLITSGLFAQKEDKESLKEKTTTKYVEWTLLQLLPSPTLFQDSDGKNARVQFGFQWHFIPLNISFNPNKYVSPMQSFFIYPARRFSGSAEIFVQPELATASFSYAKLSVFGLSAGPRVIIPVFERGENLSVSLGGKYTFRKNFDSGNDHYYGIEGGVYMFGGMFGLQYTQNFNTNTKYNISLYLKYF